MDFEAFFKLTYGLYVVSSKAGDQQSGYISNTVFQVTAEPVQIAITCSKNNYTAEIIAKSQVFAISALAKDCDPKIIGTFGYHTGQDIQKFDNISFITGQTNVPILTWDTIAWFECHVKQSMNVGTHMIFIGEVVDANIIDSQSEPLTYQYYREVRKGTIPKNAPTYIDENKLKQPPMKKNEKKYVCQVCGHVYDPLKGDPDSGIKPGTAFEDLPDDWVCPVCGAKKDQFKPEK